MLLTFYAQVFSDWLFLSILDFLLGFCFILKTSKEEHNCWSQEAVGSNTQSLGCSNFWKSFFLFLGLAFQVKNMRITLATPEWGSRGSMWTAHKVSTGTLAHSQQLIHVRFLPPLLAGNFKSG